MKNLPFGKRLGFALRGIREAWRNEASFRFQASVAPLVFVALGVARASAEWWAILGLAVGSVLAAELLNTALERVVDRLHPERHPEIEAAKDCAAGAVLVLSMASVVLFACFAWAHADRLGLR